VMGVGGGQKEDAQIENSVGQCGARGRLFCVAFKVRMLATDTDTIGNAYEDAHMGAGLGADSGSGVGVSAGVDATLLPFSSILPLSPPSSSSRRSARAEWMEWWKGWPRRGGAFPLRGAWVVVAGWWF
jgi:hypothetical protein